MPEQPKCYYRVLGVRRDATLDAIKRRYRSLVRLRHPDVNTSPDASARFQEIVCAYRVLKDASKRRLYDQYGHDFETRLPDLPVGDDTDGGDILKLFGV